MPQSLVKFTWLLLKVENDTNWCRSLFKLRITVLLVWLQPYEYLLRGTHFYICFICFLEMFIWFTCSLFLSGVPIREMTCMPKYENTKEINIFFRGGCNLIHWNHRCRWIYFLRDRWKVTSHLNKNHKKCNLKQHVI